MPCGCNEHKEFTRRQFLGGFAGAGAASFLGLYRPELLFGATGPAASADHVILLWMGGGQSHLETWDPKPDTETGGPTQAINASVPGIRISEHLPRVAKAFDDISLIRSLTSKEGSHERATYLMHTGYVPTAGFQHSTLGSTAWRMKGKVNGDLPAYVTIGNQTWPAGFLGSAYAPFQVANPDEPARNIEYHRSVDDEHFQARLRLLREFDRKFAAEYKGEAVIKAYAEHYQAAYQMMKSKSVEAFDLGKEPQAVRERYGATFFGQGCLLARRLVQVGVRFVEVNLGGWDMHNDLFEQIGERTALVDQGLSALIWDLKRVDRLDRTLVLLCTEFGRTPAVNGNGGRDHWPRVWSCVLAGGGIKGGRVIGESTPGGEEVAKDPVPVGRLHATLCKCLDIDPAAVHYAEDGRPIRVVQDASLGPVYELFE